MEFRPASEDYLKQWQEYQDKMAREKEAILNKEISEDEIQSILSLHSGSHNRWELFEELVENGKLTEGAFNKGLAFAWTSGIGTGFNAIDFFLKCKMELVMNDEELAFYNSLPDEVTIYRGCSIEEEKESFGISWTTERKVAEFFAFRYEQEDTAVYSTVTNKKDIKAVFLRRGEYEVITFAGDEIDLVTDEPTEYYEAYCKELEEKRILTIP